MFIKKKSIAVIGSTGSIGKTSLKILSDHKHIFSIKMLVCNKNYNLIKKQAKKFLPKYILVNDKLTYLKLKKIKFKNKIIILNDLKELKKFFKNKKIFDKVILGVSSINGLKYALSFINYSRSILIANKESIICGGNILINHAKFHNCKIMPIDSEHYCLSQILKKEKMNFINKIYLTASGGPFLQKRRSFFMKAHASKTILHPNWKMGKKISVDSANMVNKIFELIEAHILFKLPINKLKIKIHKESLVHSAIVYNNGLVKMVSHDTSMIIPIRNSLFDNNFTNQKNNFFLSKKNFSFNFDETKLSKYDILNTGYKVLKLGHRAWILFNKINDLLVENYLKNKIFFYEITKNLNKIFSDKSTILYCKKKIKNFSDIEDTLIVGKKIFDKL